MPAKKKTLTLPDVDTESLLSLPLTSTPAAPDFPIVGIGASAGGLEAIELFLHNVPEKSGLAFVIVLHLDPNHKGMMAELLQRATSMRVVQIHDRQTVEPNSVYIIPPNTDVSILHGVLHLLEPVQQHGLRLPIDFFFRSLADDRQERSIGVILSGMGSDGMLGLRAIKEKAGLALVQLPSSAKFDSMPLSAINSGLSDITDTPEHLPGKILDYLRYTPLLDKQQHIEKGASQSALEKVVILLRAQTGNDFTLYKKTTLYRRIERRMGIHQIDTIAAYVRLLQENPQEVDLLFRELLIGVTSFFRDSEVWKRLRTEVLPALLSQRSQNQALRAWVAGCSTGEEAYSLAIIFKEALEELHLPTLPKNMTLQIFATDLDGQAIEKARAGIFPANIAADVSEERLRRFFVPLEDGKGFQVAKSIREMVIFAPQNIIMDPPFTKLDLLTCRNLLIYLSPELQKKLLPLFHYSLNPGGFLLLGSAETIGNFTNLFTPLDEKARLYQKNKISRSDVPVEFPSKYISSRTTDLAQKPMDTADNLKALTDNLLLQNYAPAAVLTNDQGDILYISGRTGKYLEPAAGKVNWNIFAMARDGLGYELTTAFHKVVREKTTHTLSKITVGTNGGTQTINVTVQYIQEPETMRGLVLVVFMDVPQEPLLAASTKPTRFTSSAKNRVMELERELERARAEVQSIREEMQTSQEELRSTNEELQSTNEELQSTNEELTTSKEEMQSMNEELQTVNQELQAKVDELSHTSNDIKNLLDSTDIATLFLDNSMRVRRFNSRIGKMTKLIVGDVGRPITDIASELLYAELIDDARSVLETLVSIEKQIHLSGEQWFAVRVLPYRTLGNMIDGVVITFTDITVSKTLEAELRATEARLRTMLGESGAAPTE
ncbi:MAG: PAS domain-containing protein [Candidatus Kapabacteria bacterium]|nr:PAS domain-containing protein [Candidatus Kapabacteria bacterium]